jgi:hypothetical protein
MSFLAASWGGATMKANTRKIVTNRLDLDNLLPLMESQEAELATLAALPDDQINFTDNPEVTEERMKNAIRHRFCRPRQTADHRPARQRCAALAEISGQVLSVAHERDFTQIAAGGDEAVSSTRPAPRPRRQTPCQCSARAFCRQLPAPQSDGRTGRGDRFSEGRLGMRLSLRPELSRNPQRL